MKTTPKERAYLRKVNAANGGLSFDISRDLLDDLDAALAEAAEWERKYHAERKQLDERTEALRDAHPYSSRFGQQIIDAALSPAGADRSEPKVYCKDPDCDGSGACFTGGFSSKQQTSENKALERGRSADLSPGGGSEEPGICRNCGHIMLQNESQCSACLTPAVRAIIERGERGSKNRTLFTCRICSTSIGGFNDGRFDDPTWRRIDNIDGPDAICPKCAADEDSIHVLRDDYPNAELAPHSAGASDEAERALDEWYSQTSGQCLVPNDDYESLLALLRATRLAAIEECAQAAIDSAVVASEDEMCAMVAENIRALASKAPGAK